MVWEKFAHDGFYDLQLILRRVKSEQYHAMMLHDHLIALGSLLGGAEWMFKQSNTSYHTSKILNPLRSGFKKKKLITLKIIY